MTESIIWKEETRSMDSLRGYDRNPRKINLSQLEMLKTKIKRVGYHHPIAIQPDGLIISGHQRAKALQELGFSTARCSIPSRQLNDDEFKEMMFSANINDGEFDNSILAIDFSRQELLTLGAPASLMKEYDKQLRAGASEPDESSEPQARVISKRGDVWLCGDHRIMCGDSTSEIDVAMCVGNEKPNLMVTDPPYGVEYDADFRNGITRENGTIVSVRAVGKVENDERHDWREAWRLFSGNVAYVWHASYFTGRVQESLEACGFETRASIIWAKNQIAIGRGHYHWQHEPCWYMVRTGKNAGWQGDRKQSTIWNIDKPSKSETGHSTQKPIECMRRPMENNSVAGDAVYDPFLGSGTSVIAAQMLGRRCIGMELSPAYVDVIVRRFQKFAGVDATHAATGETFNSMEAL